MSDIRERCRAALYDRLLSGVDGTDADVPIEFENVKFVTPAGSYLSCWMVWPDSKPASIGNGRGSNRHRAWFCVAVFVKEGTGTKAMWEMAGIVEAVFSRTSIPVGDGESMNFQVAKSVQNQPAGGFWAVTVMAPFYVDTCGPST